MFLQLFYTVGAPQTGSTGFCTELGEGRRAHEPQCTKGFTQDLSLVKLWLLDVFSSIGSDCGGNFKNTEVAEKSTKLH